MIPPEHWKSGSEVRAGSDVTAEELFRYINEIMPRLAPLEQRNLARAFLTSGDVASGRAQYYFSPEFAERITSTRGMTFTGDDWMMPAYARYFSTRANEQAAARFDQKLEELRSTQAEQPTQFIGADGRPATYLPPSWVAKLRRDLIDHGFAQCLPSR